jgi:hypothetical protein
MHPAPATSLTVAGTHVALMMADPAPGCAELGNVDGENNDYAGGKNNIRNKAGELGANYVRWETALSWGIRGTAYRCPTPAASTAFCEQNAANQRAGSSVTPDQGTKSPPW